MKVFTSKGSKEFSLGQICNNINETTKNPLEEGIDRYIGLEHILPNNLHITSWGKVADGTTFTKKFKKGQVLFGKRRAYQKKAALAGFKGVCSSDILVLEANEKIIDNELFPFLISSDALFKYAVKTSAGSLSPRTKFQDLAKFKFILPPKEQQRVYKELLWSADNLISKYEILFSKLKNAYKNYLNQIISNSDEYISLDQIGSICYGMGVPPKPQDDGISIIRATNISEGEILEQDMLRANPQTISKGKRVFLEEGDILVVRSGAYTGDIGYINKKWSGTLAGYDLVFKPNKKVVNPYLIKELLLSHQVQNYFKRESTRSAQPHLNAEQLKKTLIPQIRLSSQNEYALKIESSINLCKAIGAKINEIKKIRNEFVNQIFNLK